MPDNGSIYRFHHFIAIDGLESDDRTGLEFGQKGSPFGGSGLGSGLGVDSLEFGLSGGSDLGVDRLAGFDKRS